MTMTYRQHKEEWVDCELCELCETRRKVVLYRGTIPCDVLFIGEAPGPSEDKVGSPFKGPAGHLLDQMIENAELDKFYLGFGNLVGCIPLGPNDNGDLVKLTDPDKAHIKACAPRLVELTALVKPKAIVRVGKLADKWVPELLPDLSDLPYVAITHPGAILRADITQKGLQVQKACVQLEDLLWELTHA